MLTRMVIRNFRRLREVAVELGNPVVFIGPNNSGKTSALQALALWHAGVQRWRERRGVQGRTPQKRPGVSINRRDLVAIPVPDAKLLWRNLHVRDVDRATGGHLSRTVNVRIEILVEGVDEGEAWSCGLEFDYANEESIYCRPLRPADDSQAAPATGVPSPAHRLRMAFLPPMSGLATNEPRLDPGAVQVRIGEGRTADVLRNLCYQVHQADRDRWRRLVQHVEALFGASVHEPAYVAARGEIEMTYSEPTTANRAVRLDITAAGRGLQQTLLLLAYLYANPGCVLLLDEPDAHLEILRQRQTYNLVCEVAREVGSQVVAASHSEVILNEAGDRDVVVTFVGRPHRIDDRGSQVLKALRDIGFDQYYLAEVRGWVLYLEGSTDLAILAALAARLGHPAAELLSRPFVRYVENKPQAARDHFYGLREAKQDLVGIALFDQGTPNLRLGDDLVELAWVRREIENYIALPEALIRFARFQSEAQIGPVVREGAARTMQECIRAFVPPVALDDPGDAWWARTKMSDEFLDRVFEMFYGRLGLPNLMRKSDYHLLAPHVPVELIDPDVRAKLDAIVAVAQRAQPAPPDA